MLQKRSVKGVRSLFLFSGLFRSLFGHFFRCFCHFFRHFFARLLLPDTFCGRVIHCTLFLPDMLSWLTKPGGNGRGACGGRESPRSFWLCKTSFSNKSALPNLDGKTRQSIAIQGTEKYLPPPPREQGKKIFRGKLFSLLRCFLNGVFQSGVLRGWSRSARAESTKLLENTSVFRQLCPSERACLCRKPRLRICKTLFGKHRLRTLKNIYHHHHTESKKRTASEGNSGSIQTYGRYGNAGKTSKPYLP